jgi:hypothetical protein
MRYTEFASTLVENTNQPGNLDKNTVIAALAKIGYTGEDVKVSGNKLFVLVDAPEGGKGSHREQVMMDLIQKLGALLPGSEPRHVTGSGMGSKGGIMFGNSPILVGVKDKAVQGGGSSGKGNEENLRSLIQMLIMEYGKINLTFVDKAGKKLGIKNCNDVVDASMQVQNRQKADLIFKSSSGQLPVSLKQVTADQWESADSLFGSKAKEIIQKLVKDKVIQLQQYTESNGRKYYKLSKEIVVEPTQEETMDAIFGSDLLGKGGVVVQTFDEHHFTYNENNIIVSCDYVIKTKEDIPTSHLMVWLIRNNTARNNPLPGLRTLGVTLTRGIGTKGTKDVVLVDKDGNVIQNPNQSNVDQENHRKSINKSARDYAGASAVGRA